MRPRAFHPNFIGMAGAAMQKGLRNAFETRLVVDTEHYGYLTWHVNHTHFHSQFIAAYPAEDADNVIDEFVLTK